MKLGYSMGVLAAFSFAAVGCSKGKEDALRAWQDVPRHSTADVLDGVKFTVDLPDGLERKTSALEPNSVSYKTSAAMQRGLTVGLDVVSGPITIADAKLAATRFDYVVQDVKELGASNGFVLRAKSADDSVVEAIATKPVGDKTLRCNALLHTGKGGGALPDVAKKLDFVGAVCASIAPSGTSTVSAATVAAAAATGNTPANATPAPIAMSVRMREFVGQLGSHKKNAAALRKYGAQAVRSSSIADYDLVDPQVIDARTTGPRTCHEVRAKAGVTTRGFDVCWEKDKIVKVTDLGFR